MIARSEDASAPVRWTVGELLEWTEGYFRRLGIESPRLDAEILLAAALEAKRIDLYTEYRKLVEPQERARFRKLVERRARREPVAYITGTREFFSLEFAVSPAVLVPRPETEHVVERVLEELRTEELRTRGALPLEDSAAAPPTVLDLGTGSGNIAISVAVNAPSCRVDAVDWSEAALTVARANADTHGVLERIRLLRGDWFQALPPDTPAYDVLASNPPYVSPEEFSRLPEDVRVFEPREALCAAAGAEGDGLEAYRALASQGSAYLKDRGLLVLEVGAGQSDRVTGLFERSGWQLDRVIRDYGGIERVVAFRSP